jgi:hypothetical protein
MQNAECIGQHVAVETHGVRLSDGIAQRRVHSETHAVRLYSAMRRQSE